MEIKISNKQIKQLSLALSINDVLDCIKNDCDSYLRFLNEELYNQEITEDEYNKELNLIEKINKQQTKEKIL